VEFDYLRDMKDHVRLSAFPPTPATPRMTWALEAGAAEKISGHRTPTSAVLRRLDARVTSAPSCETENEKNAD